MKLFQRVDYVGRRLHFSRNTIEAYPRWGDRKGDTYLAFPKDECPLCRFP
jgi:hypothetical protein